MVGGVVLYAAHRGEKRMDSRAAVAAMVAPVAGPSEASPSNTSSSHEPSLVTPAAERPSVPNRASEVERPRQSTRSRDNFAEEVALLSRAEAELHRGRPARTLELLGEHERRFANAALIEERMATRVQALCALGRVSEAEAQLGRLKPGSLDTQSSPKACVGLLPVRPQ